jgi:AcrR family transcriptional regulator
MPTKDRYHHGNLRQALLEAGVELLKERGIDGLKLRAVAARAGVSHAAPAHHFPHLRSLLTALAALAFERFAAAMREERARAPATAIEQVRAAERGYVRFVRENPDLFRLMFQSSRLDWGDEVLKAAATAARRQLSEVSGPVAEALGDVSPAGRRAAELLVWSSVHGYAHLLLEGQLQATMRDPGDPVPEPPDIAGLVLGRGDR